ncbi:DDE-type integrase/transposase/recombinase [Burkholderia multivorans]|uniref:DDE-type integrase/transposase/recombinase n=1 Tax=Burkholderia multivorans TaxID=87883 RepID=UPI001EEDEAB9|nr:DDE-type integrase/transposase/recombinase [Burkholderia multivorans]
MSTLTDDAWSAIEQVAKKRGAMSLAALFALAFNDETPWNEPLTLPTPPGKFRVDDVLQAIAERRLFVDLDYDDLSDPSSVVICSSLEQLEAVKWRRPPPHTVSAHFEMTVDVGTEFLFRGRPEVYTVTAMPVGKVLYRDSESRVFEEMTEMRFQQLLQDDIQLLSTPQSTEQMLAQHAYVTDEQIQTARRRFQLIKQLEQAEIPHPYSIRTIQRWQQKIRNAGESCPLQMLALIPQRPGGRGAQILEEVLALIREVALGANNPTNPSGSRSYDAFVRLCHERGVTPCARNTFYIRSAAFRDVRAREGARRAYNMEPAIWYLHRGDKIHGGHPFHRVHIDHTKLDVIIKVRGHGGRLYRLRPWLTIAIDAETRAVLAFYLAAHAPSTVSCMMVMRAMVAMHKRVPDFLVCDNGKEFHSNAFENFCDLNDITLEFRPAHESRFGGVIERLFGTTNQLLIHELMGNTKAMQHVRTLTRSVDPLRADHLTFVELHGLLDYFFFVQYNRERRHPAHDHTPDEYMNNRFMVTGRRLTRLRPYDERFMLQTLIPVSRGGTREIDNQMGIKVGGIWYWADEFAARRYSRKKVEVRVDMWNVCVAYGCEQLVLASAQLARRIGVVHYPRYLQTDDDFTEYCTFVKSLLAELPYEFEIDIENRLEYLFTGTFGLPGATVDVLMAAAGRCAESRTKVWSDTYLLKSMPSRQAQRKIARDTMVGEADVEPFLQMEREHDYATEGDIRNELLLEEQERRKINRRGHA